MEFVVLEEDTPLFVDPRAVFALQSDWATLDLSLGVVDASVIALAERHGVDTMATLDHRHFGTVKPGHLDGVQLVP